MKNEKVSIEQVEKEVCKLLHIETLETRMSDGLDFHDTAVWAIRDAVELAFRAGREFEKQNTK